MKGGDRRRLDLLFDKLGAVELALTAVENTRAIFEAEDENQVASVRNEARDIGRASERLATRSSKEYDHYRDLHAKITEATIQGITAVPCVGLLAVLGEVSDHAARAYALASDTAAAFTRLMHDVARLAAAESGELPDVDASAETLDASRATLMEHAAVLAELGANARALACRHAEAFDDVEKRLAADLRTDINLLPREFREILDLARGTQPATDAK